MNISVTMLKRLIKEKSMSTLNPVSQHDCRVTSSFWNHYIDLIGKKVLPYQWKLLNDEVPDAEPSGCIRNFRIAAGLEKGEFYGAVFQDSDLAKWLDAVGHYLAMHEDKELEALADSAIELVGKAQQNDGYLDTYFIISNQDLRWKNLRDCHELYCAGHFIEAAVSYFNATGKRKLLDITIRLADLICSVFGDGEGQIPGYPGHEEIEFALIKLSEVTGNDKYLDQARYFILKRGSKPNYFEEEISRPGFREVFPEIGRLAGTYSQSHEQIYDQTEAVGHAVRAMYFYTAAARLAGKNSDRELMAAVERLWENTTGKKMYVTGGIGSTSIGESFSSAYDLPNDSAYCETCASIGLMRFSEEMFLTHPDSRFGDVIERALYNTVLSGISFDGERFFYVNPLMTVPSIDKGNPIFSHVRTVRQRWFGVACCPPNIARTLPDITTYAYAADGKNLYIQLYVSGSVRVSDEAAFSVETDYPSNGNIKVTVCGSPSWDFMLHVRIPSWCDFIKATVNGNEIEPRIADGYLSFTGLHDKDEIEVQSSMEPFLIFANPRVAADAGSAAVQYGPFVYCAEEADNGPELAALSIRSDAAFSKAAAEGIPERFTCLSAEAEKETWDSDDLYSTHEYGKEKKELKLVPYCTWNNRGEGEMRVWLRRTE